MVLVGHFQQLQLLRVNGQSFTILILLITLNSNSWTVPGALAILDAMEDGWIMHGGIC